MPRKYYHDYRNPSLYHLTISKAPPIPDFGQLTERNGEFTIQRNDLGQLVCRNILQIPQLHPQLKLHQFVVMPDHLHLLVQVLERLPYPIGNYIGQFKVKTGQEMTACYPSLRGPVFEPDFL